MVEILQNVKNIFHLLQAIAAVLVHEYPASSLTVIGVTGTDGKTTTSTMIYHLLKKGGYKVALISTVAAYIGDDQIDTGFHVTSPSPWQLQRLLQKIKSLGFTHVVLESTSHGLDQYRLFGANITYAVITNITHEHLDYHKTYARYVQAKAKIFAHAKVAVINYDDQTSYQAIKPYIAKNIRVIEYSLTNTAYSDMLAHITKRWSEAYNQSNALAASLICREMGMTTHEITANYASFAGVPGRMQVVPNKKGLHVIVDFAHTPNALQQALIAAKKQTKGKVVVVFGAAGARDKSKRPLMGKIAAELADEVILTAEDPRHEDVRLIINQIKSGIQTNHGHIHAEPDRRQAIRFGISLLSTADTMIVCGKGHEQSLNLDGVHEIPWSDVAVCTEELRR
jgi:UDP-N-acetylmuramoyl-L-alanyl-D-glutamate--2,6-diaminopimelate ligase